MIGMTTASVLFFSSSAMATEMPPLAKKLGCIACHSIDKKIVGPAWKDVSDKYTGHGVKKFKFNGKEYPLVDGLVMKVSNGGSGNWGTAAMTPNDPKGIHKAEITELVKFVLDLSKKK
jgi:cytochrome c551/c552